MNYQEQKNKDLEKRVTTILRDLNVPEHLSGYEYLRSAILLCMDDFSYLNHITTKLYPTIAKKYNTTPFIVERRIRYAIEIVWLNGNLTLINSIFEYSITSGKSRPTNLNFIATIVDRLHSKQDIEKEISTMLRNMNIPCHLSGYEYLQSAILLCIKDSTIIKRISTELYPTLAIKYNTTSSAIEAAIRHAIENVWINGNFEIINSIFGYTISSGISRPTNS